MNDSIKMKSFEPSDALRKAKAAFLDALKPYGDDLTPEEILALLSNMTGQTLALLDQEKYTPDMGINIIMKNIEAGNKEVVDALMESQGSS